MNSLLIYPTEVLSENTAEISSPTRLAAIKATHTLKTGGVVRVGIYGGRRAQGVVQHYSETHLRLVLSEFLPPLTREGGKLICGVARPQTAKKVLQAAVSFGISEVHFIQTELSERSYFSSNTYTEEGIHDEIAKSLEQCCDTLPPLIECHTNFKWFVDKKLPQLVEGISHRIIAHTSEKTTEKIPLKDNGGERIYAVGPESGWSREEVTLFTNQGFYPLSLGARMMRVEHAVAALLGACCAEK